METGNIEIVYPLSFRQQDAVLLGQHLHHRHSVDIVGMKRVGISNFLRFFLNHEDVKKKFISSDEQHLFIPVDLNDLVERELYAFWTLTFKRIIDGLESAPVSEEVSQKISNLFLSSIQANDLFLLIDGIRQSLTLLVQENILPTLFFLRFDRIKDVVTPEYFDNLQGLRDATNGKLCYVFTSFRSLDALSPQSFTKADMSAFSQIMYMRPCSVEDMRIIAEQYKKKYALSLSSELEEELLTLVGGNVQYLQIALIILNERKSDEIRTKEQLFDLVKEDERVGLLGEELWESLTVSEKEVLSRICKGEKIGDEERKTAVYIFETGIVQDKKGKLEIFNPFFADYISTTLLHVSHQEKELVFSKKEHLLFTLLQDHSGQICERDNIIEAVWPEYKDFGVSDWSIDRLVARVRSKLKKQLSPYEIRTIRTRGYMLNERT